MGNDGCSGSQSLDNLLDIFYVQMVDFVFPWLVTDHVYYEKVTIVGVHQLREKPGIGNIGDYVILKFEVHAVSLYSMKVADRSLEDNIPQ